MTRKEAIKWFKESPFYHKDHEPLNMAIKALEQEPKMGHWIDADGDNAICGCCNRLNHLYGSYCKHCGARMYELSESEG